MYSHKFEGKEENKKLKISQDISEYHKDHDKNFLTKRKSMTKIVNNSGLFPGLLSSYSSKFIRKASEKSKSPPPQPQLIKKKIANSYQKQKRKSFTADPNRCEDENFEKNTRNFSPPKNQQPNPLSLSSSLQQEIKRIKALSRFMLDMKLPSALPSRPKKEKQKQKRILYLGTEVEESKPLIQVKMQRKNGFLRPIMLVRETIQTQTEQKQVIQKKVKNTISKPKQKQKLKTAPEVIEFGLHIKSHQEVFDQQTKFRQTKNEIIKRFRSTWTRKLSKSSKKIPQVEVSPWIVTEQEHD